MNKKSVNWDGYNSIASTNGKIRDALDCFCTGPNWCYVAAHSAGNLQIGYALALYGTSTRSGEDAGTQRQPGSAATDARRHADRLEHQVGGRRRARAAGGSELANSGDWAAERTAGQAT